MTQLEYFDNKGDLLIIRRGIGYDGWTIDANSTLYLFTEQQLLWLADDLQGIVRLNYSPVWQYKIYSCGLLVLVDFDLRRINAFIFDPMVLREIAQDIRQLVLEYSL